MRWITIHDRDNQLQHILIKKKDGTILGGMGGTETGNKIDDVFDELKNEKKEMDSVKQFRNNALQGEEINEEYDVKKLNLSEQELKSIIAYTGNDFDRINKILRNPEKKQYMDESVLEKCEMNIKNISSALSKSKTTKPIITYRGIGGHAMETLIDNMKVGNVWRDDGFVSTSSLYDVAEEFAKHSKSPGYILEIHVPKGSRAMSVDSISHYSGEEYEVLLDKGSEFLIKEIDNDNRIIVVELQQK